MSIDRKRILFSEINGAALSNFRTLLQGWIPNGRFCGSEYIALNPLRADKSLGSFSINWRTGQWSDFASGDRGSDPISLYAYLKGVPYVQAANKLANNPSSACVFPAICRASKIAESRNKDKGTHKSYILKLWNDSFSAENTVVETYLHSRGITAAIPLDIRLLAGHLHKPSGKIYPVMLAAVRHWDSNDLIAVHRTWLLPDGSGKAPIEPNRMMLGATMGGGTQLSPPAHKMVIAEGLETSLSVMQETRLPVWAALSTSGMMGLNLPDLPMAQDIIIAVDNDPAGRKAALRSAEKWTKEGRQVRLAFPPPNQDFNDLIRKAL